MGEKLKLGNGTSILIYANILSALNLPSIFTSQTSFTFPNTSPINIAVLLFYLIGIVYVQEAELKLPIDYATIFSENVSSLGKRVAYLPFKIIASGVMPLIFASSLLSLPST